MSLTKLSLHAAGIINGEGNVANLF
jgi:hypothetical protein